MQKPVKNRQRKEKRKRTTKLLMINFHLNEFINDIKSINSISKFKYLHIFSKKFND